jgi:hypothetical protein
MLPGGDLRHDTAIDPVELHLRGDTIAEDLPSVPDDGNGSLIAGGFYC